MTTRDGSYKKAPPFNLFVGILYRATIHTERIIDIPLPGGVAGPPNLDVTRGRMVFDLLPRDAPRNVNNFVFLAREGFYRNGSFHRVVPDTIIQGGCPLGDGTGGPGYHVEDDEVTRPYLRGCLAMASAGKNRNGSQFFILAAARISFPPNYTIIGRLMEGGDVLDALAQAPVEANLQEELSRPVDRLRIADIEIEEVRG